MEHSYVVQVIVGKPGSGKSTHAWELIKGGLKVFEVDWIYSTFHHDLQMNGKGPVDWDFVLSKFTELVQAREGLFNGYTIITGDTRVGPILQDNGYEVHTIDWVPTVESPDFEPVVEQGESQSRYVSLELYDLLPSNWRNHPRFKSYYFLYLMLFPDRLLIRRVDKMDFIEWEDEVCTFTSPMSIRAIGDSITRAFAKYRIPFHPTEHMETLWEHVLIQMVELWRESYGPHEFVSRDGPTL
jgi:hypothetical protein